MATKEEILIKHKLLTWLGTLAPEFSAAMDEFVKQECIEFLKYWNYKCVGYPAEADDEQNFEESFTDYLKSKENNG